MNEWSKIAINSSDAPVINPQRWLWHSSRMWIALALSASFLLGMFSVIFANWVAPDVTQWARNGMLLIAAGLLTAALLRLPQATLRARHAARIAQARLRALFEQASRGQARLTREGIIIAINKPLSTMLGRETGSLVGERFEKLFLEAFSLRELVQRKDEPMQRQMLRSDGLHFCARLVASAPGGGELFVAVEDVTQQRNLRDTHDRQLTHDYLTDSINRREIERRLESLLLQTQQTDARHTCCFLDIDAFALINDTCGHAAGDKALRMVATALSNELALPGWVGRLGGDEFIVLFEFVALEDGMRMAARFNRLLADTALLWGSKRFGLSASFGVAEINRDTPSVGWLLRAVDSACYLAKTNGRNRVQAYVEADHTIARRREEMEWAGQLRNAVAQDRLLLYAQRIAPLDAALREQPIQYEVLVRLRDDAGNIVLPGAFMSAAEHFFMASIVDRKVITATVEFIANHAAHRRELALCHINLSGQSIASAQFRQFVLALLKSHPQVACKLCFELTETASVDLVGANEFITAVRKFGCQIALDDFGNGLASFAYLKALPVNIVKIDGIFVRDISNSALDVEVVKSIVTVCHSLNQCVVAEGVETLEVMNRLRELGVDAAQGFFIHRPEPIDALL